jgi:hypothetical protein
MQQAHEIEQELKRLRMPGAFQQLDHRLVQAQEQTLGYLEFLSLVSLGQRNSIKRISPSDPGASARWHESFFPW